MTGDPADILARAKSLLPRGWFADVAPIRDAVFGGIADAFSWVYSFILYAKQQTRIATAVAPWLDIISLDFFGTRFPRNPNETDPSFSTRIRKEILRPRATRPAIIQALTDLTGIAPTIVEFFNGGDCGAYSTPGGTTGFAGYGLAGAYGSVIANTQFFVNAFRPATTGIPNVPGYGTTSVPAGFVLAGYGISGEYGSLSQIQGPISDAQIYATVAATQAAGTIGWTQIRNAPGSVSPPPPAIETNSHFLGRYRPASPYTRAR